MTIEIEFSGNRYTLVQEIGTHTRRISSDAIWSIPAILTVPIATEAEIEARIPITFEPPARVVSGYRIVSEGTFSINDDQIEFVNADGDLFVYTFRWMGSDTIHIEGILNIQWSQNRYMDGGEPSFLALSRGFRTASNRERFADLACPRWR